MDHQGRFRRTALEAGIPEDEISAFLGHLRLPVRLSGGADGVPAGHLGGTPRLPPEIDWPVSEAGPLPFVFSVDCVALPRIDGSPMPASGALLFFLDHQNDHLAAATGEQSYSRVLHTTSDTPVDDGHPLSATLTAAVPPWFDPDDEDDLSPFQEQLAHDLPHLETLRAVADSLWPSGEGLPVACVGGYADQEMVTGIAEQTLPPDIPATRWYSHVEREAHRLTGEWLSLARFSLSDNLYSGSFVIHRDDLAATRLDRAYSITTFSE